MYELSACACRLDEETFEREAETLLNGIENAFAAARSSLAAHLKRHENGSTLL